MTQVITAAMVDADVATQAELDAGLALKVALTGDQTVAGIKTFSSQPVLPQKLTALTPVATTSGNTVSLTTAIPSWAKRITLTFNQVSQSGAGTSSPSIRLGPVAGIETTGYQSSATVVLAANTTGESGSTTALLASTALLAAVNLSGQVVLTLADSATNTWVASGVLFNDSANTAIYNVSGRKALAGPLTQIQLWNTNGTDTFDLGAVTVMYE